MEMYKNPTGQELGALTYCLNSLAWEPVSICPGKYCGPVVIPSEDQTLAWKRGCGHEIRTTLQRRG
jgi:hypothetical protein